MMRNCIYALLCFLILTACKKDDNVAPPITAENTFSCKINGDLFVPEDYGGFPVNLDEIVVTLFPDNSWRFIFGDGEKDIYIYII